MATLAERAAAGLTKAQSKGEQNAASNTGSGSHGFGAGGAGGSGTIKLSKALQAEVDNEAAVESVELDGLAVMKILQHAASSTITTNASGFLFGLNLGSRLSVSNSLNLPANHLLPSSITTIANLSNSATPNNADEKVKAAKVASEREKEVDAAYRNARNFIATYQPRARELNLDSEVVGGYFVAKDGMDMLKEGVLADILIRYQYGIGTGGGAAGGAAAAPINAGDSSKAASGQTAKFKPRSVGKKGIAIVYDASSSTSSSLDLRAYALSPAFISLFEGSSSFQAHKFDYASLASAGLTPNTLLVSYPVTITSSSLLSAFLASNEGAQALAVNETRSSFTTLSASDSLENNLKSLIGALDSANSSIQSLGYQGRAARGGYAGAQSSTADSLNRLDSVRTLAVAEGAAKSLAQEAGVDTVRAWAARSSVAA